MKRITTVLGLIGALVVSTGCFDIEQSLTLNRDLSGKAGFRMGVDMEPMVMFMLQMGREMEGKKGEPTKAEIDKAKKEFLTKKTEKNDTPSPADIKRDAKKELPKGVELLDVSVQDQGMKMTVNMLFGFDNVSKLAEIKLKSKKQDAKDGAKKGEEPEAEEGGSGPGPKNPAESPFSDLQVKDEGKTILVTSRPMNPAADIAKGPGEGAEGGEAKVDPQMQKQIETAFKNFRIAFKIDAPFQVLESNATRKEGTTLFWEYDYKTLEKMKGKQLAEGIRVRYKK